MQSMHSGDHQSFMRRFIAPPHTVFGKSALGLVGLHALTMLLWRLLHLFGQEGGQTFFTNPWLAGTLLLAGAFAVAAGGAALLAIIRHGERSIFDIAIVLFGLMVLAFGLGEVLVPH